MVHQKKTWFQLKKMTTLTLKRKRKTTKRKTKESSDLKLVRATLEMVISKIQIHKSRFDLDYEEGKYDLTPKEADVYDDGLNDVIILIRKM
jgi:hypothetical protein